jgi:serine phosphatase RsbU (regulator of sigma subunit)
VAGRAPHAANAGGFCDWFPLADDRLAIVLAQVDGAGACAGMTAAALRAAFRAHGERVVDPARLLEAANRTLWTVSSGDQTAAAACLFIENGGGQAQYAWAGAPAGWWLGRRAAELFDGGLPLGTDPLALYASRTLRVAPGELLVVAGDSAAFAAEPAANGACLDLGRWAQANPGLNARALADLLGRRPAARAWPLAVIRRT